MTYIDKPHGQRYTGRGCGWAKKRITKRQARRIARYNAGLIIDAVLDDGWEPDCLIKKYGQDGFREIKEALMDMSMWLRDTGHPDGVSSRQ